MRARTSTQKRVAAALGDVRTSPWWSRVAGSVVQRCETTPGAVCGARVNARRLVRTPERRCAACGLRRVRAAALQVCVGEAKGADASSLPLGEEKRCQGRRLQSCQKKIDTRFSARTYELAQNGSGQRYGAPLFGKGRSLVGLGCMEAERRPTTDHHTRGPLHRLGRWARSEALRCAGPHGHTTWLGGWAAWFDGGGGFRGCRAGALSHTVPSPTGGDPAPRRPPLFWCAGVACACAPCAHPFARRQKLLVARQHAGGVLTSLIRGRERCRITLAPHGAAACSRRARFCLARRRAACWRSLGGKSSGVHIAPPAGDPGVEWGVLCARRRVAGDVPGLWRGRRHARITQRRHVGEPEPELYFLGVSGQFHELVKRRKNRLRASRAPSRGAPGRAHPVGNARRAHRCLAGLARRAGRGRAQCTEFRRGKFLTKGPRSRRDRRAVAVTLAAHYKPF